MGKLLFWVVVIIGALVAARLLAAHNRRNNAPPASPGNGSGRASVRGAAQETEPESMVRCAHCGIHMPRSDAVLLDGQTWCSTEHAKLGVRP